jgi:EAL domain-containing protein (putative c-di-GMP-specific phosphodiesterase class I)/GGDEF domain-containing protein
MAFRPGPVGSWRGWTSRTVEGSRSVTSARLTPSARPHNRLFPKTRSWFALEAPIELLSPLSVLRVLFALAAVTWSVTALVASGSGPGRDRMAVAAGVTALLWVATLVRKEISATGSRILAGYWVAVVALMVWWGGASAQSVVFALFFIPGTVFTALFLGRRDLWADLGVAGVSLWAAFAPSQGIARALSLAVWACLALSAAPLAVLLLARAARRHDTVDPDTGLPNGFGLAQRLAEREQTTFVVAVIILEGIGEAREALGYQVGTELLRRAVEDLGQVLPGDAVIGRVEGDELVVTLGLDGPRPDGGAARTVAEDGAGSHAAPPDPVAEAGLPTAVAGAGESLAGTLIRGIGAGRYLVDDVEVSLRAHVGLSAAPWDGTGMAELVRTASLSARRAAATGRPFTWWHADHGAMTVEDLALLGDLRRAPERGQLTLAYQPQVAPGSATVGAVEALLRWDSLEHGRVPPGVFIPLAERTGLIDRLTRWVVTEALDAQARWRQEGLEVTVSVNLSAKSLSVPDLAGWILGQLDRRRLPATCLTVEVTETAVAETGAAAATLAPLHRAGIRISIDDFGTGFTSLAALPTLPLDELKVDQCFVLRAATSPADAAIVRTVAELGHRMGLEVVAEGVETAASAAWLADLGFDLLQGYHFARPMAEVDLLAYLRRPGTRLQVRPAAPGLAPGAWSRSPA